IKVEQPHRVAQRTSLQHGEEGRDAYPAGDPQAWPVRLPVEEVAEWSLQAHRNAGLDVLQGSGVIPEGLDREDDGAVRRRPLDGEGMIFPAPVIMDALAKCGQQELP